MKLVALAIVLVLSGCAHLHGIYRDASTKSFPPAEEVLAALKQIPVGRQSEPSGWKQIVVDQIPDVKSATHFSHDGRTPLDRALAQKEGSVEEFAIRGEKVGYNMQFTTRSDRKNISMQMFTHESQPASFRVEEVRNLMRTVYAALRARFPDFPREADFHEIAEGLELEAK
jgi:hypothetical protein